MAQMRAEGRVDRVERVRELVVARGPVRVVPGANRLAAIRMHDEPVAMSRHQARVARGEKWRRPYAGFESCSANFACDFFQATRKFCVGGIPIAERRLK